MRFDLERGAALFPVLAIRGRGTRYSEIFSHLCPTLPGLDSPMLGLRRHPEIPRYRAGHRTVLYRREDIEHFLEKRRIA